MRGEQNAAQNVSRECAASLRIAAARDKIILQDKRTDYEKRLEGLRRENLTLRGRQSREVKILDEELRSAIKQRARSYHEVSKERNCSEMLSPAYLEKLRLQIWSQIVAGLQALRDRHEQERWAAGERLPHALQEILPRIYESPKWRLKDAIDDELELLRAEWEGLDPSTVGTQPESIDEALDQKSKQQRRDYLLKLMDTKGWSAVRLAQEAKLDYKTVKAYTGGTRKATSSTRSAIAVALGVNVETLP
jgi:lambda repressor-like predicted transcriptional regulator